LDVQPALIAFAIIRTWNAWYNAYKNDGFVVVGGARPRSFAFERLPANVAKAVKEPAPLPTPVALDNNFENLERLR